MKVKLSDFFYCGEKNSGLYSDIFYKHQKDKGDVAIYSSQKKILGCLPSSILKLKSIYSTKDAIIMYRKGNAGTLFIPFHDKWSCSENAIPMILKDEYKDKINMKYLITLIQDLIYERATGKSDNANANWDMVKSIEINYNDDKEIISKYKLLEKLKTELKSLYNKIISKEKKQLILKDLSQDEIKLSTILKHTSRNDSLSEEGIYNSSKRLVNGDGKIIVLSGSFSSIYGEIPFDDSLHFVKDKPCLQVITRGNAGRIRFLKKGTYATNTNSMLLTIRDDIKDSLEINNLQDEEKYLKFLMIYLSPLFENYCSSSDLSVFALTEVLEQLKMPLIKLDDKIIEVINENEKIRKSEYLLKEMINEVRNNMELKLI